MDLDKNFSVLRDKILKINKDYKELSKEYKELQEKYDLLRGKYEEEQRENQELKEEQKKIKLISFLECRVSDIFPCSCIVNVQKVAPKVSQFMHHFLP